jgi:hypothetical protein
VLAGDQDVNGAGVESLYDGQMPTGADQPATNFFFTAGTEGGRLFVVLNELTAIRQINTYSWHAGARGPQVYKLYAGVNNGNFRARQARSGDPVDAGWKLVAEVDTRKATETPGGQYGVSVVDSAGGTLAEAEFLLFVIEPTETDDPFGNTFFSEIDIVDGKDHPPAPKPATPELDVVELAEGYTIEFDVSEVPELKPWVDATLKPVCITWYPKIVAMLPSEDYEAPKRFRISFRRDMQGVAHCAGTRIECAGNWFLANREGEAAGAVVHEMVHVVQQYRRGRGGNRNPGWLVEGLADYIRWFLYEPENLRPRVNPDRAKYTDSYRTTGAFLDYLVREHDGKIIEKFNAAMRRGEFNDELWKESTGKPVDELWADFVGELRGPAEAPAKSQQ